MDAVAIQRQLDANRHHAFTQRGIRVEIVDRFPLSLGHARQALEHDPLDVVLGLLHGGDNGGLGVLLDQAQDLALTHRRGFCLGLQIPHRLTGSPGVGYQQLGHIVQENTSAPDTHRRDAQPLAEMRAGVDIEGAGHAAADIRPVPLVLRKADDFAFGKDRADEADVVEVRAAAIGVIDRKDIPGVNVAVKLLQHGLALEVQGSHVHRDVAAALHDRIALGIAQRRGEIARIDDKRVAGTQDLLAHQIDAGGEGVLQDYEGDRIESVMRVCMCHGHASSPA